MESRKHRERGTAWTTTVFTRIENQLTSALEELPSHCESEVLWHKGNGYKCVSVRWDPKPTQNPSFARQSLLLHVGYYMSITEFHRSTLHMPSSLISSVRAGQACIQLLSTANFNDCGTCTFIFDSRMISDRLSQTRQVTGSASRHLPVQPAFSSASGRTFQRLATRWR